MQRFVRIGSANVQVLSTMMHDVAGTERVATALASLRPEAVMVDRSVAEWTRPNAVDPLQKIILDTIPGLQANVLWRSVGRLASQLPAEVVLLHQDAPGFTRSGIAKLRSIVKKEGFESTGDPSRDLAKFHQHYVARVPEIWQAIEARRDRSAARLRATFETRPRRAAVIMAYPDGDIVCDRIQAMRS